MKVSIDVDLRDGLMAARDQGQRPTCIVLAASAAHELHRGTMEYLSPEYLFYAGAQRTHKDPARGLSRIALRDALMNDGQPLEAAWPYVMTTPPMAVWKPPSEIRDTNKATIDFVVRTVAEVQELVADGTPVLLLIMATVAMYLPDAGGVVRVSKSDKPTARHALLAVGCGHADDGDYLLVRNSWGVGWGMAGHGWIHDSYLASQLEMTGTIT